MQLVHESLPTANSVDLDRACVCTLASVIADVDLFGDTPDINTVDYVTEAGELILADVVAGTESRIAWGKTAPDADGFYEVVIDAPAITVEILTGLWILNVLDGDCPTAAGCSRSAAA
jgi:hypothetical protein